MMTAIYYWIIYACLFDRALSLQNKAELYNIQSFELIRTSSYPHFVMFYAPWCSHCKRLENTWDKFAKQSHSLKRLKIAKVDCSETTSLCASESIKAYPTLRLFNNKDKFTYRGNRNLEDFNHFVKKNVHNLKDGQVTDFPAAAYSNLNINNLQSSKVKAPAVKVLSAENFKQEVQDGYTFVDFFAPWCSHCVMLEPIWKQLGGRFADDQRITIAKVDCTADPELCKEQMITGYPSLHLFKDGNMIAQYNEERSLPNLTKFVLTAISDATEEETTNNPSSLQEETQEDGNTFPSVPPSNKPDNEFTLWYDRILFEDAVKSNKVIVYFHSGLHEKDKSMINLINYEIFAAEIARQRIKLLTVVIDCAFEEKFCSKYTNDKFPSIIYFNTLNDYIRYNGEISRSALLQFLNDQKLRKVEL